MKKVIVIAVVCLITVSLAYGMVHIITNTQKPEYTDISTEQMIKMLENKETFAVYFYQRNCPGCDAVRPIVNEFIKETGKKIYAINLNLADNPSYLAQNLAIQGSPTVISFKQGEEVDRLSSVFKKEQLQECINGTGTQRRQ